MNPEQVQKLQHGLYIIYWKEGGKSLASVGSRDNGQRWLAPTNWMAHDTDWSDVDRVELVATLQASDEVNHPIIWNAGATSRLEPEPTLGDNCGGYSEALVDAKAFLGPTYSSYTDKSLVDNISIRTLREMSKALLVAHAKSQDSLANNLCPNHRNKQVGKPCLVCEVDRLEADRQMVYSPANEWKRMYDAALDKLTAVRQALG